MLFSENIINCLFWPLFGAFVAGFSVNYLDSKHASYFAVFGLFMSFFLAVYALFCVGFQHSVVTISLFACFQVLVFLFFLYNVFTSLPFYQKAYCDNVASGEVVCESTVSSNGSAWSSGLLDSLNNFLHSYSMLFFLVFLSICCFLLNSFLFGRSKIMEHIFSSMFYLLFTGYGFYRCYFHLYASVDLFFCLLFIKSFYIGYKNVKTVFDYAATSVDSKEDGVAARHLIQEELCRFNLKVFLSYLQLALMQFYFLSTVVYQSLKENSNMAFELTINDFALVRELNFFFLTVTLALMALILVFAWSKDIYNGDTIYVSLLLVCVVIMPIFYYAALLLSFMHLSWLHAMVFILAFFYSPFFNYVLNVRARFVDDNIMQFLSAFSVFSWFTQISFFGCSFLIYALSRYLRLAYLSFAKIYNECGANISAFCNSSQFSELSSYIEVTYLCFLAVLIITSVLAVRVYFVFLKAYVNKLSEINIYLLCWQLVIITYLITIVLNRSSDAENASLLLTSTAFCFSNKKSVPARLLGFPVIASGTQLPSVSEANQATPVSGSVFTRLTEAATDFIIQHSGTTLPGELVSSSVELVGVAALGITIFAAKHKGAKVMDKYEAIVKARRLHSNSLACADLHYLQALHKYGHKPEMPYANDSFYNSSEFARVTRFHFSVKRQLHEQFQQKINEGHASFGFGHGFKAFMNGPNYYLDYCLSLLKIPAPDRVEKEAIVATASRTSYQNMTLLKKAFGYSGPDGVAFHMFGTTEGALVLRGLFRIPVVGQNTGPAKEPTKVLLGSDGLPYRSSGADVDF